MDVKLPKLGEGADSGVVVNIFVKEGDTVAKDQAILELENEKAVASIPSTGAGVVAKVHVKSGDRVGVGARLITITESGQAAAAPAAAPAPKPAAKKIVAQAAPEPEEIVEESAEVEEEISNENIAASPSVRKIARELGINLGKIRGSESGGRIVIGDLRELHSTARQGGGETGDRCCERRLRRNPRRCRLIFRNGVRSVKKPVTPLRKVIARRMAESWNSVPRVTQFDETDFTRVERIAEKIRGGLRSERRQADAHAVCAQSGGRNFEEASDFQFEPRRSRRTKSSSRNIIHLGIAVDTDQGLMVPVIRDVDKKSMLDLAKELESLAAKARDRKISADEMKGGTFTISNQGAIGGAHFTPIVNMPEVAILGLGRGAMKPVVRDGKIEARMLTPIAIELRPSRD